MDDSGLNGIETWAGDPKVYPHNRVTNTEARMDQIIEKLALIADALNRIANKE